MSTIAVRSPTAGDATQMAEVHIAASRDTYAGIMPDEYLAGLDLDRVTDNWSRSIADPDDGVTNLVGEINGVVQGICTVGPFRDLAEDDDPSGELWMINLHPDAQGTGLAKALHDWALDHLRSSGHHRAALWVAERNPRARRFYEREGWTLDTHRKDGDFGDRIVVEVRYSISL